MLRIFSLYNIFFLLGLVVLPVAAQNTDVFKDPEATKILDKISQQISQYQSLKIGFFLKLETSNGKFKMTNEKKGIVWIKKEKYKAEIDAQEIFCNGTTVWNYDKNAQEVQVTNPDPKTKSFTPQKLLTNFYQNDFSYKMNPKKQINGKPTYEIELMPIDKSKPFFKVYLYIEHLPDKTYDIVQGKIFEKNGNRYTYTLKKLAVNKKIEDAFFEFQKDKHPKVEVVDLR